MSLNLRRPPEGRLPPPDVPEPSLLFDCIQPVIGAPPPLLRKMEAQRASYPPVTKVLRLER
eukprot:2339372-Pyramimonas_sp.AAC.1